MAPVIRRDDLERRYDVTKFTEDAWHQYSDERTRDFLTRNIPPSRGGHATLLNAGSGVYEIAAPGYEETFLDLFEAPIRHRSRAVCGSVEAMPFEDAAFDVAVCVGEVISYCDPAKAIAELGRALRPGGTLILDYSSSRSARHWFSSAYARAADIVEDRYNGSPERVWVYGPDYIQALLDENSLLVAARSAEHCWSGLLRRLGVSPDGATKVERLLRRWGAPRRFCDTITIAAKKSRVAS